jgi:hypothetical protein
MGIISESINGVLISVVIKSSNLQAAVYNTETSTLSLTFNNGSIYEYEEVPWNIFTKFRLSESQGKFFTLNIKNSFKFTKIK